MHLIIDGYNYIGRQGGLRGHIEAKRAQLVSDLARYRSIKGHAVTVVFDGGRSGDLFGNEEWKEGVSVRYSRQGETADDVIVQMAEAEGSLCIVVTSDRAVAHAASASGAMVVSSGAFEKRLQIALLPASPPDFQTRDASTRDAHDAKEIQSVRRDGTKKSGNPFRRPKKQRKQQARLQNL